MLNIILIKEDKKTKILHAEKSEKEKVKQKKETRCKIRKQTVQFGENTNKLNKM